MKMKRIALLVLFVMTAGTLFARNWIIYRSFDWQKVERLGYVIYYPKRMEWLIPATVKVIEQKINSIYSQEVFSGYHDYIEYYIKRVKSDSLSDLTEAPIKNAWSPVQVIYVLYPSMQDFTQQKCFDVILPPGVLGFTETLRFRVFLPYTGDYYNYLSTLAHEAAHAWMFIFLLEKNGLYNRYCEEKRSAGNLPYFPLWFIEGWAEMLSRDYFQKSHQEYLRCLVYEMLSRITVNDIEKSVPPLNDMGFESYYLGYEFLTWMKDKFGVAKIIELLEKAVILDDFHKAWREIYGEEVSYFEKRWHNDLRKKYFRKVYDREIKPQSNNLKHRVESYGYLSYDQGKLAYYARDAKWGARIEVKNLETGEIIVLHHMFKNQSLWYHFSVAPLIKDDKVVIVVNRAGQDELLVYRIDKNFRVHREKILRNKEIISIARLQFIDKNRIVFEAIAPSGYSDIYIWNVENEKLKRLTNDFYYERNPVPFKSGYLFISNRSTMYNNGLYWLTPDKKVVEIYRPKDAFIDQIVVNPSQSLIALRKVSINHSPEILVWVPEVEKVYTVWSDFDGISQIIGWLDDINLIVLTSKKEIKILYLDDWHNFPNEICKLRENVKPGWQILRTGIVSKKADRRLRYIILKPNNFYFTDATGERRMNFNLALALKKGKPPLYNIGIRYQNLSSRLEKYYGFTSYQLYKWRYNSGKIKFVRDNTARIDLNFYYPISLENGFGFGFSPNIIRRYYTQNFFWGGEEEPQRYQTIGGKLSLYLLKDGVFTDYWGAKHGMAYIARVYADIGLKGVLEGYVNVDFRYYLRVGASRVYLANRLTGLKSFGHDRLLATLAAIYPQCVFDPFNEIQKGVGTDYILFQTELRFPIFNFIAFQPAVFPYRSRHVVAFGVDGSIFWYGGDIWYARADRMHWMNRVGCALKLKLGGPLVFRYERYKYVNTFKDFNLDPRTFDKSYFGFQYEF